MKKLTAILLSVLMLVSAVIPALASGTQQTPITVNRTATVAKAVTLDGTMGKGEGWGSAPVAYLNKTTNISDGTQNSVDRGAVYVSADADYIYLYMETYAEYRGVVSSSNADAYRTWATVDFLDIGGTSVGVEGLMIWGSADGKTRSNAGYATWTTGIAKEEVNANGYMTTAVYAYTKNIAGGTYNVEFKFPIPDAVKEARADDSQYTVNIGAYQTVGKNDDNKVMGIYTSDTTPTTIEVDAGVCKAATIAVQLPRLLSDTPELTVNPAVSNIAGKTVNVDGIMSAGEGWASLPYLELDSTFGTPTEGTYPKFESFSKLYVSTDGEYLYGFFKSTKENWGETDNCLLYFDVTFATDECINLGFHYNEGQKDLWRYRYAARVEDKYITPDYDVAVALTSSEGNATAEFKIELPEGDKTLLKTGTADIKIGVLEKENGTTLGDYGKCPSANFAWNKPKVNVKLPMVNAVPKFTDVYGKKMNIDGSMGASESWSSMPYMALDATTTNGTAASGNVSADFSGVRYSADANNIYVFFDTAHMESERVYLQFAFDGKTAGNDGKDYFLIAELDLSQGAENVIASLTYGDGLAYAAGDAMFDGVSVAVKRISNKIGAELCVPIPKSVADKRLESAVTVMVGAYEKFSTDAADGYVPKGGYNAAAPNVELVLTKDDASVMDMLKTWIEDSKKNANYADLTGLSVNVFGDDMFAGGGLKEDYTWAAILASKYGWTLNNHGVNGNMISEFDGVDELPMVLRYRQLPNNAPDMLIVAGGYNDFLANVPLGESGSRDTSTYIGAINSLIDGLNIKYKGTPIVFITPWNFAGTNELGLTYSDYAEAMAAACEAKGVYCFKAYDKTVSGVDMQNADFRAEYALSSEDTYHLNLEGSKIAMPKLETFLNETMTHWLANYTPETDEDEDAEPTPETEAPADDGGEETSAEEEEGGCGSALVGSIGLVAVAALGTCIIRKKKEN